jgi:quercetin dioxygenase-like cupin family protein
MAGREIFASPDDGRILRVVTDSIRVLASGTDTGGAYEVFELSGPRESGPPLHSHPWSEAYVMLEGEVEVTIADNKMMTTPGCFANVPAGTLHTYKILSEGARFIVITSPAGAGDFFTELDREAGGSVEDLDKIVQIALQHGFNVPPPPVA